MAPASLLLLAVASLGELRIGNWEYLPESVVSASCKADNTYGAEPHCPTDDSANARELLTSGKSANFRAASSGSKKYTVVLD